MLLVTFVTPTNRPPVLFIRRLGRRVQKLLLPFSVRGSVSPEHLSLFLSGFWCIPAFCLLRVQRESHRRRVEELAMMTDCRLLIDHHVYLAHSTEVFNHLTSDGIEVTRRPISCRELYIVVLSVTPALLVPSLVINC